MLCKLCGGQAAFLCETYNEHSRTQWLSHYRCRQCGIVFVGNEFNDEELGEAYGSCNMQAYYEETAVETGQKMQRSADDLARLLPSKSCSIIDVGTGNGSFMEVLRSRGYTRLACHEIPQADLSGLKAWGCSVYQDFDYASVPSGVFDAVTLLDVAEHVRNPLHLFRSCSRMLKEGGLLYLHTPVVTRLDRLMHGALHMPGLSRFGKIWQRGRTSIFHLQNYTGKALQDSLSGMGFSEVHVEATNERSWPVSRYVRVYLCEKNKLPTFLAPWLTPFFYPWLASEFFNANKAVVWARKQPSAVPRG
jgi:SAM-dependent methyltransferase